MLRSLHPGSVFPRGLVIDHVEVGTGLTIMARPVAALARCPGCDQPSSRIYNYVGHPPSAYRHRLNRGGDRAANSALRIIAIGRLRTDARTKAYMARRITEGHSKLEAVRCLKRYIAREVSPSSPGGGK